MLRLWDLESGGELRRFEGHRGGVTTVAVLPDGQRALSGSFDGTLRLWDLENGAELACFIGDDAIGVLAISPVLGRAIVGDTRGRVMVFAVPTI
jgi:WD40 repeat protein